MNFIKSTFTGLALIAASALSLSAADIPAKSATYTDNPRDLRLTKALDAFMPHVIEILGSPGMNIAVARGGKVIWEGAYGYADVQAKKPQQFDTVFRSGSMGKVYTAVAIMQLVERGVISLDDPAEKYLPFPVVNKLSGDYITIFNLMTHTSGFGGDGAGSVWKKTRPLEDVMREKLSLEKQDMGFGTPTWTHKPGEIRWYSNIGIGLLGLIVQHANPDGLSYSDFIENNIMKPLGMVNTQYPPAQSKEYLRPEVYKKTSKGYGTMGDLWIETADVLFEVYPAGGFVSIPREHVRLYMAIMNGGELDGVRILKKETVVQMLTPQVDGFITHGAPRPRERQGLIFWLRDFDKPTQAFHHGGGHMFGWRTMAEAWPTYDTAVVYAFNEWHISGNNKNYYKMIDDFIETVLASEQPVRPATPTDIDNLAWKLSYLRGVIFTESYYTIGLLEKIDMDDVKRVAREAQPVEWGSGDQLLWDEDAFMKGVKDMRAVKPTAAAIHAFAKSDKFKISLKEARMMLPLLGGPSYVGSLAGLLLEQ